ncbi:MAG: CdaR family protein [Verrucomicrobiales bacterium]
MAKRDLITNNFGWKIIALMLAVAAWFALNQDNVQLVSRSIGTVMSTRELVSHPITISKPASDLREFKVSPSEVDITMGGSDWNKLKQIDGKEIQATVDLSDFRGTNGTIPIKVYLPPGSGATLERLVPLSVYVELIKDSGQNLAQ